MTISQRLQQFECEIGVGDAYSITDGGNFRCLVNVAASQTRGVGDARPILLSLGALADVWRRITSPRRPGTVTIERYERYPCSRGQTQNFRIFREIPENSGISWN